MMGFRLCRVWLQLLICLNVLSQFYWSDELVLFLCCCLIHTGSQRVENTALWKVVAFLIWCYSRYYIYLITVVAVVLSALKPAVCMMSRITHLKVGQQQFLSSVIYYGFFLLTLFGNFDLYLCFLLLPPRLNVFEIVCHCLQRNPGMRAILNVWYHVLTWVPCKTNIFPNIFCW